MTGTASVSVRKTIEVAVPRARAFEVFTRETGSWWPPHHHIGDTAPEAVVIEPRRGGRLFERSPDGAECDWGTVLSFEPPERLLLLWQLDPDFRYDPDPAAGTEVEVLFLPEGPNSTRVELEHRGFERLGERGEGLRADVDAPGGWSEILAGYVAVAQPGGVG